MVFSNEKICNVGCNIVAPVEDEDKGYTRDVYVEEVWKYRQYGFRHIEFSHLLALSKKDAVFVREACRCAGVIPWSVHSEHWNEGGSFSDYLKIQEHCAMIADALDARIMVCHLPNLQPRFDFDRALQALTQLADITRKYNVRLAIENCLKGDTEFIIRIIDAIGRKDVGFNFDTGHAFYTETDDIASFVRKIGKRLITTHLHDNFGANDDHQPPGLGAIEWNSVLAAFKEIGYTGPLMMEMTVPVVKSRRTVQELRTLPLEKELVSAYAYLNHLWNQK